MRGGAVDNAIVDVDLTTGGAGRVLAGGNDFYASPRLSPNGRQLAWLTWRHPNMPWVGTELWVADIASDGTLGTAQDGRRRSRTNPCFNRNGHRTGALYFISDRSGWWNLYRLEGDSVRALCPREADFAQAPWVFGMSSYAFAGPDQIICSYWEDGIGHLARLDLASLRLVPIDLPYTDYGYRARAPRRSGVPRGFPDRGRLDRSSRPCDRHDRGAAAFGERPGGARALFLHTGAHLVSHRGRQDRACLLLSAGQSRPRRRRPTASRHWW